MDESHSLLMRRLNDCLRQRFDPEGLVAFFCECQDDECYRAVWLSPRQYDHLRGEEPLWTALAELHDPEGALSCDDRLRVPPVSVPGP